MGTFSISEFNKHLFTLVAANCAALIMGLILVPIITRIFTPEMFGVSALFISIVGIFGGIICLSYEQSIILEKSDALAANMIAACFFSMVGLILIIIVILGLFGSNISMLLGNLELNKFLWLVPLCLLIQGFDLILSSWFSRGKRFKDLAQIAITRKVSVNLITIIGGLALYPSAGMIIVGYLLGNAVVIAILGLKMVTNRYQIKFADINKRKIITGMKRYSKFPIYTSWSVLINNASWHVPVILMGMFFNEATVGWYFLTFKIIQLPMSLIGKSVSRVIFRYSSEHNDKNSLSNLVEAVTIRLFMLIALPALLLGLLGSESFSFIFGEEWVTSGLFAQILCPWMVIWFITSPVSCVYYVINKQEKDLQKSILILVMRILSIIIGGIMHNATAAIMLYSITSLIAYGSMLKQIYDYLNINAMDVLLKIKSKLMTPICLFIIVLLVNTLCINLIITLGVALGVSIYYYTKNWKWLFLDNIKYDVKI
jgi:lipopolysaccharide exporter